MPEALLAVPAKRKHRRNRYYWLSDYRL